MGPEHAEQAASPILGPATLVANAQQATNTSLSSASSNFSQRKLICTEILRLYFRLEIILILALVSPVPYHSTIRSPDLPLMQRSDSFDETHSDDLNREL